MTFSLPMHRINTPVVRRTCIALMFALGMAAIFWVCTYKIMDRDFWWHIKAGEIMLRTGNIIADDPFAYTREGLPYLATHEWLAQILLHLLYSVFGSTGIILFRGVIANLCVGLLLLLAKRQNLAYAILGVWAVVITKGSFLERPQLFTFAFFSLFLLLAFRFLDATFRTRVKISIGLVALSSLWVNMHGGAALLGIGIVGIMLLDAIAKACFSYDRRECLRTVLLLTGMIVAMMIAMVLPPNGADSLQYVIDLLTDKTILFIAEHQPRALGLYISELWPFYVLAIAALIAGKRHWVFNGLLLLVMGYLSRQAFRHEIFFIFSAVATCYYQSDRSERIRQLWKWMGERPKTVTAVTIVGVLFLSHVAYERSFGFERQDNLFGFGQFDLARGAYDFVERENITGNMFNTYGIGGYLIYRGYPDRKVFIDGRNVDYGFEYMARTYAAGINADRWEELEHLYGFTYAIVDYDAIKEKTRLPYSSLLDTNPNWVLVYLDDWTAVYLKKTPAHQRVIDRFRYTIVNATRLEFGGFSDIPDEQAANLSEELRRVQNENPAGVKATLALANIAFRENRLEDAKALIEKARHAHLGKPEPLALLAAIFVKEQEWEKAAETYGKLLRLAGSNYPDINYGYIAEIFEKAGHPFRAWYYRIGLPQSEMPNRDGGGGPESTPSIGVNPAMDAVEFAEEGLNHAEAGRFAEAEKSFNNALKMNPGSAETWNNLCALLMNMKREKDAAEACKHGVEIDPEYADAHYNLALAYYYSGLLNESATEALLAKKWGREKEADELLLLLRKKGR